jgi:hypothetical protein
MATYDYQDWYKKGRNDTLFSVGEAIDILEFTNILRSNIGVNKQQDLIKILLKEKLGIEEK